jgi:hypothetical protein
MVTTDNAARAAWSAVASERVDDTEQPSEHVAAEYRWLSALAQKRRAGAFLAPWEHALAGELRALDMLAQAALEGAGL